MGKTLIFILFILAGIQTRAQHCPYDYVGIIVLKIISPEGDTLIPGLSISLLDSAGQPVMVSNWTGSVWQQDTSRFWVNAPATTHSKYIDNENPLQAEKIRYWFAGNNYVTVCARGNYNSAGYKIKIVDEKFNRKPASFKTMLIQLKASDIYPLCTHFSNWTEGPAAGFVPGFKPVEIHLEKK